MDADGFDKAMSVFHGARGLSADERGAYVERACEGDEAMRREVLSLLAACGSDDSFLQAPAALPDTGDTAATLALSAGARLAVETDRWVGRVLGDKYRLERPIGRGGMGTVYLALRVRDVRQQVAIKLAEAGVVSPALLRRFTVTPPRA